MDDPDGIMLRFLRARKWKIEAGVAMVSRTSDSMKMHLDEENAS